jgi:hypothetical protein
VTFLILVLKKKEEEEERVEDTITEKAALLDTAMKRHRQ